MLTVISAPATAAAVSGNFTREEIIIPLGIPLKFQYGSNEPCTQQWILDGKTIITTDYITLYNFSYTFLNRSDVGEHNLTVIITDEAGNFNGSYINISVGSLLVVNSTSALNLNVTLQSVLAAPEENFTINITFDPPLAKFPKLLQMEGTSELLYLLKKDERGHYRGEWLINESNSSVFITRHPANNSNGTFLASLWLNATVARNLAGTEVPINITNAAVTISPRYDINGDFIVNVADMTVLRQHYGETTSPPYPRYDINEDGIVNIADLTILRNHYGEQIPTV